MGMQRTTGSISAEGATPGWSPWHPRYWRAEKHGKAWEKVKQLLRREWALNTWVAGPGEGLPFGQWAGPEVERPRPPRPAWHEVETAIRYGFAAREEYGPLPWNEALERTLALEWEEHGAGSAFAEAAAFIRHGFCAALTP